MPSLRVALIQPFAHYPGHHWRDARSLGEALGEAGVEVEAVVAAPPLGGGNFPGPIHQCLPGAWTWTTRFYNPTRNPRVTSLLHNVETFFAILGLLWLMLWRRFDVVHFMDGTHLFQFLFTWLCPKTVVLSIFGDFSVPQGSGWKPRVMSWLVREAVESGRFAVIGETEGIEQRARPWLGEHIHTIPYAIEIHGAEPTRAEARRALGLPEDANVALLFGTQRQGKSYGTVFLAAETAGLPVHLLFVGKTISDNSPRMQAAARGFTAATFVERFVHDSEVPLFFRAADVALLPYDKSFDRGSGVLLDACRFGLPVLSSRTGYLEWFLEKYRTGLLFDPDSAEELSARLREFFSLPAVERAALQQRIAETAVEHSWPVIVRKYLAIYDRYRVG